MMHNPLKTTTISIFVAMVFWAQLAKAEQVKVAVGEWPPYLSADLKQNGVVAHLISDIFLEEGLEVEFTFLPWGRAYAEAANGKYDLTAVWMHKAEREKDFLFSEPVLNEQFVFFHLKSVPFNWNELSDLQDLMIGGGIKYSYGPEFDAALESGDLKIERVATDRQNFSKLLLQRVHVFPQEVNVGYSSLRKGFSKEEVEEVTHHPKPLLNNFSYLLFPKQFKNSEVLLSKFNKQIKQFKESGRYESYFKALQRGEYQK
jgi:polar amino acid transport system substrate-binding protein